MTAHIMVTFHDGSSLETFVTDDEAESLVIKSDDNWAWNVLSNGGK